MLARADSKVSALSTDGSPATTDQLYEVKNPDSTPLSRNVRIGTILNLPGNSTSYFQAGSSMSFVTWTGGATSYAPISEAYTGSTVTTTGVPEGMNLYFTGPRAAMADTVIGTTTLFINNQSASVESKTTNVASGTWVQFHSSTMTLGQGPPMFLSNNPLSIIDNVNAFYQVNIQNLSAGDSASGDYIVTNNLGNNTTGYVDLGINGSGYNQSSFSISASSDAYLYASNRSFEIGTADPGADAWLKFFTGGTTSDKARLQITNTGVVSIVGNQLSVNGTTYTWNAGLGGSGEFLQNNNGTITSATPAGGGGGGSSTLAVGTGTASSFTTNVASPTVAESFEGSQLRVVALGTTAYVYIDTITPTGLLDKVTAASTYGPISRAYNGNSALAVTTGSVQGFTTVTSTGVFVIVLDSGVFTTQSLTANTTVFASVNRSSFTMLGPAPTTTNIPQGTNLYVTSATVNGLGANTSFYILNGTSLQSPAANSYVGTSSATRVLTSSLSVVGAGNFASVAITPLSDSTTAFYILTTTGALSFAVNTSSTNVGDSSLKIVISTTASYAVTVGTTTLGGPYLVAVSTNGHVSYRGVNPAVSSCGTSPTINENLTDLGGTITPGATAAGCTVTFGSPWLRKPHCVVSEQTMSLVNALSYTVTTTALTVSQTAFTSAFDYVCVGAD